MIRFGKPEDIPELKNLWKECFDDEDAYIDAFFQALYQGENVLLSQENGMLAGASFFLPGSINMEETDSAGSQPGIQKNTDPAQKNGSWQQIRYVYALAVYPQYRGHGIAGRLLKEAARIYESPLIAEPAEESLVGGFYEPLGFSKAFYVSKKQTALPQYDLQAAQSSAFHIQPAEAEIYRRVRDSRFKRRGYVSWPEEHLAFAISEHRAGGGDALLVTGENGEDILLYYTEDSRAVVTETTLPVQDAVSVLMQCLRQHCDTLVLTGRTEQKTVQGSGNNIDQCAEQDCMTDENGENCLRGVMLGSADTGGYLNVTLD